MLTGALPLPRRSRHVGGPHEEAQGGIALQPSLEGRVGERPFLAAPSSVSLEHCGSRTKEELDRPLVTCDLP